jgi:hypothetical protein
MIDSLKILGGAEMKGLKVVLWICTIAFLMSFVAAVLPWQTIVGMYKMGGYQPPTTESMDVLIFRLAMVTFGMIGVFFRILTLKPLEYGPMLPLAGYGMILLGVFLFTAGIRYEIPLWAIGGKGFFLALLGVLILCFRKQAMGKK